MSWDNDDLQDLIANSQRNQIRQGQDAQLREAKRQSELAELARKRAAVKEIEDNLEKLRQQAKKGDLDAMESLIRSLSDYKDYQERSFWILKASKLGSVFASNYLIVQELLGNEQSQEVERLVKIAAKTDIYQDTSFAIGLGALHNLLNGQFDKAMKGFREVVERKDLPHFSYFLGYILKLRGDEECEKYPNRFDDSSLQYDSPYKIWELYYYSDLMRTRAEKRIENGSSQFEDYSILAFGPVSEEVLEFGKESRDFLSKAVLLGYPGWPRQDVLHYYLTVQDYVQALSWMEICLESEPSPNFWNINAINNLIYGYLIPQKQWEKIEHYVTTAIEQDVPDQTTNAICNGAIALYMQGKVIDSIDRFEMALKREDGFAESEASWWLGQIHKRQGNRDLYKEFKTRSKKAGGYKLTAAWSPF